jgi:hypothetical protein
VFVAARENSGAILVCGLALHGDRGEALFSLRSFGYFRTALLTLFVALALQQRAQHALRRALGVHVGRVHVVHAMRTRVGHDGSGLGLIRLVAEHHRAQAQRGHLELALAKKAVLHGAAFAIEIRAASA